MRAVEFVTSNCLESESYQVSLYIAPAAVLLSYFKSQSIISHLSRNTRSAGRNHQVVFSHNCSNHVHRVGALKAIRSQVLNHDEHIPLHAAGARQGQNEMQFSGSLRVIIPISYGKKNVLSQMVVSDRGIC